MWTPSHEVTYDVLLAAFTKGTHIYGIIDNKWPPLHRVLGLSRGIARKYVYDHYTVSNGTVDANSNGSPPRIIRHKDVEAMQETLSRIVMVPLTFSTPVLNSERNVHQLKRVIALLPAVATIAHMGEVVAPYVWKKDYRNWWEPYYTEKNNFKPLWSKNETPSKLWKNAVKTTVSVAGPSSSP